MSVSNIEEFLFRPSHSMDANNLRQGDLLENKGALKAAVKQAHSYYAEAETYTHFMVVSQSCDLSRRGRDLKFKANYITLAAVRPFAIALQKIMQKVELKNVDLPIALADLSKKQEIKFKLERFLNNTNEEEGMFFISKDWHRSLEEDMCVFLQLTIALRGEHYDACLKNKIGELDDIFAAKVGWVTGNIYSRIATRDLNEYLEGAAARAIKDSFTKSKIQEAPPFLHQDQIMELQNKIEDWKSNNPGKDMSETDAEKILLSIPDIFQLIARQIVSILASAGALNASQTEEEIAMVLSNRKAFKAIINRLI